LTLPKSAKLKSHAERIAAMTSEFLDLELMIKKPPNSVRAWWTDYPDDYHAKNPTEQPYRILTTRRLPNGREVRTFWKMPDGSTSEIQEILNLKSDGSWTYEVPYPNSLGIHVLDEFRPEPAPNGTKLVIHSTLTPRDPAATSSSVSGLKEFMIQGWKQAAEICEHDAP
jgi:hypothetical protein